MMNKLIKQLKLVIVLSILIITMCNNSKSPNINDAILAHEIVPIVFDNKTDSKYFRFIDENTIITCISYKEKNIGMYSIVALNLNNKSKRILFTVPVIDNNADNENICTGLYVIKDEIIILDTNKIYIFKNNKIHTITNLINLDGDQSYILRDYFIKGNWDYFKIFSYPNKKIERLFKETKLEFKEDYSAFSLSMGRSSSEIIVSYIDSTENRIIDLYNYVENNTKQRIIIPKIIAKNIYSREIHLLENNMIAFYPSPRGRVIWFLNLINYKLVSVDLTKFHPLNSNDDEIGIEDVSNNAKKMIIHYYEGAENKILCFKIDYLLKFKSNTYNLKNEK